MNWKQFWQQQGQASEPMLQVGRKGGMTLQHQEWLADYAAYIANVLNLTKDDVLLDVCCGNGLLTHHLAKHCKAVLGIDFSQTHIDFANQNYASPIVHFKCMDALQLETTIFDETMFKAGFTKVTLCFSFQYFESVSLGLQLVQGVLKHTTGPLFLGDVPDRERFFVYYNSFPKIGRLIKQMLLQQNDMGKFWSYHELAFVAKQLNRKCQKIQQPKDFPYAHYRMDYLFIE
jgi:ubiquinone/menaquinone biosynthesis C-methylase UbiE